VSTLEVNVYNTIAITKGEPGLGKNEGRAVTPVKTLVMKKERTDKNQENKDPRSK